MSITLAQLCRHAEKTHSMKLVAGQNGLANVVRWVHVIEDSDVPTFLHGGELIFTTGIGHSDTDWLLPFAQSLKKHNVAGLVLNIGPYIEAVPSKLIVFCENNDFPLYTLPWDVRIVDITYSFCRRIIENEEVEKSITEAFRNLIFSPESKETYAPILERNGFEEKSTFLVMALSAKDGKSTALLLKENDSELYGILKKSRYPTAMFFQNKNLIIIRQNNNYDHMKRLLSIITENRYSVNVGISEAAEGYGEISARFREAVSALEISKITNRTGMFYNEIGVYRLLNGIENLRVMEEYVDSVLGGLIKCDSINKTDYVHTLKTYLECSGSVIQTSEILGIHRNTVNYKIRAIREIINDELTDDKKMNLLLALHVKQLLDNKKNNERK